MQTADWLQTIVFSVTKQWDYCCHVLICMVKTMVCSSLHFVADWCNIHQVDHKLKTKAKSQGLTVDFNWFFLVLGKPLLAPYSFNIFVCYFPKERIAPYRNDNTLEAWSRFLLELLSCYYKHLQKCWDALTENRPFLLQIAACHTSVGYITTHLPSPLHSKLFQSVKKNIFTTCHLGELKLAFTSPDIISVFLTSRTELTVLLLFEFLKKHHPLVGQFKNRIY